MPARQLLKFSTPRDPAALAAFINLRVLNPEHEHWRRGVEAAVIYAREYGNLRVPFTFRVPAIDEADAEGESGGWTWRIRSSVHTRHSDPSWARMRLVIATTMPSPMESKKSTPLRSRTKWRPPAPRRSITASRIIGEVCTST